MRDGALERHQWLNNLQTMAMLLAMFAVLSMAGWLLAGGVGVVGALLLGGVLLLFTPAVSPSWLLRLYHASPMHPDQAPHIHAAVHELASRAALPRPPEIFYVPSAMLNAFAVGGRGRTAIALTDGIWRALSLRELVGVLAHEVSHLRNNDTLVMGVADLVSRITSVLASAGQLLLLINLPLLMWSQVTINWWAILLLIAAPAVNALIQLALSRTREYDADLGAVALTGDPRGLASALEKIDRYHGGIFEQLFLSGNRVPDPSLLRTHPPTEDRVRRLEMLAEGPVVMARGMDGTVGHAVRQVYPTASRHLRPHPRWHVGGLWY